MHAFAYNCLSEDQLVFTKSKVASTFPQVLDSSDKFLCLGLLQCARSLLPVGQGLSFHFVHLTIQEFLAALHLVTLPNEEKLKVCEAHARSSRFAMVWRFVFGLGCKKERSYSRKVVCLNDEVVDQFFGIRNNYYVFDDSMSRWLMFCHCSMESSDDVVCSKTVNLINGQFEVYSSSIARTPQDCVAVFHVLRRTFSSGLILRLDHCGLNDKLLEDLAYFISSAGSNLQVKKLSISGNKLTDKGITDLLCRASASLSSLKSLSFSFTQSSSASGIADIIPLLSSFHCLSDLYVSDSPLGVSGIQCVEVAIQARTFVDLKRLGLPNTLTNDADINGALLATLLPSIASHCPHLKYLDLSRNDLGVPGASAVGELITIRSELKLDLSDININAKAVAALFPSTRHSEPCCLSDLNLRKNPIGYDGLLAIFRKLRIKTLFLDTLDLTDIDLTISVTTASQYHNILLPNTTNINLGPSFESRLTNLHLGNNSFSGNKVLILAECVQVCMSLEALYCWECSLTSSEVTALLDHLKHSGVSHKSLEWWDLSYNSIDDEGVKALIENIPKLFPSLGEVPLYDNPVSDEVERRLKEALPPQVSMRRILFHS